MSIKCQTKELESGIIVFEVEGEVDMECSPNLQKQLVYFFRKNIKGIIVDLSRVTYIDSSGIATFVEGLQWSHSSQKKFRLVGLTPPVNDIFQIARLTTVFEIFGSREEALVGI